METPKKSATSRMRADPVLAMTLDTIYDKIMRSGHLYEGGTLVQIGYAIARHLGLDCPAAKVIVYNSDDCRNRDPNIDYGNRYGVDWEYAAVAEGGQPPPRTEQAEPFGWLVTYQLREANKTPCVSFRTGPERPTADNFDVIPNPFKIIECTALYTRPGATQDASAEEVAKVASEPPKHLLDGEQQNQPEPGKHDTVSGPSNTATGTMDVESDFASEPASLVVGKRYPTAGGWVALVMHKHDSSDANCFRVSHPDRMLWHYADGRTWSQFGDYHITSLIPLDDEPAADDSEARHAELAAEAAAKIGDAAAFAKVEGADDAASDESRRAATALMLRLGGAARTAMHDLADHLPEGFLFHLTVGRRPKGEK